MTNPRYHINLIAQRDRELAGQLKSIVKLLKVWNLANGRHLSSVHIELMVAAVEYLPIASWPVEVMFCLERLLARTATGFPDPWIPGGAIDRDLPQAERAVARRLLEADLERARQAEAYRKAGRDEDAIARWTVVYAPLFPAYG